MNLCQQTYLRQLNSCRQPHTHAQTHTYIYTIHIHGDILYTHTHTPSTDTCKSQQSVAFSCIAADIICLAEWRRGRSRQQPISLIQRALTHTHTHSARGSDPTRLASATPPFASCSPRIKVAAACRGCSLLIMQQRNCILIK